MITCPAEAGIPIRPWEVYGVDDEVEELTEIQLDVEAETTEEARTPATLRDPGAPTEAEVEAHNVTHMPYRSWCPSCVAGKARDRMHKKQEDSEKGVPEISFDYAFLAAEGEETIAIQVARDRRTRMIFAHVVPKKGFTHEHGAQEMIKDIKKLGYSEVILKCDGEPALKSVQEEVKRRREDPTILENSPVGDSRSNGVAERAVQALGEQVRVLRRGLEQRLGVKLSGKHPVTAWLVEHSAELLSRYLVGEDGRTGYERLKGKKYQGETVEFGEKVHYRLNLKAKQKDTKLEVKWGEGFFLGKWWRTGEAVIGTANGILLAGTIRRVGGHRRWDREGLELVRGVPWQWDPEQGELPADLQVRWLKEDEVAEGRTVHDEYGKRLVRIRLRKADFLVHGFSAGCLGCQALIAGTAARGHTEACRDRMNKAMEETAEGRVRLENQTEKENTVLARMLEMHDEEQAAKRMRTEAPSAAAAAAAADPSSSAAAPAATTKKARWADVMDDDDDQDNGWEGLAAKIRKKGVPGELADDEDMEVSMLEKTMQEDLKWNGKEVSDMCDKVGAEVHRVGTDMAYYDENTWEELDPVKVMEGEQAEMNRFKVMGVYDYASRQEALQDIEGKFVKVKWVRTNKGTKHQQVVKCRLVAQELGYGQRMDELFSGTPALMMVRVALVHAAKGGPDHVLMVLDVKCAFLYGECRRRIYIELPRQDPRSGDGGTVGVLRKAMYGTRDAPQIWQKEVQKALEEVGFEMSILQPSVYFHKEKNMLVIVHVDDFLCSGNLEAVEWLYETLKQKYDLKKDLLVKDGHGEVKYLNRTLRYADDHFEMEGDPKHVDILLKEWSMANCKSVDTPLTKNGQDCIEEGDELDEDEAR